MNLASFINGPVKQTPLSLTVDLEYASEPGKHSHINLGYVTYRGNLNESYLGISYAEPPLGNLHFRATVPLHTKRVAKDATGQPVNATHYPDFCVQGSLLHDDAGGAGSEDCLKVNVHTPRSVKPGDKLPVLVYIHGGDNVIGSTDNWPFEHWIDQRPLTASLQILRISRRARNGFFGTANEMPPWCKHQCACRGAGYRSQCRNVSSVHSKRRISAADVVASHTIYFSLSWTAC
ncbi:Alpha/Beta hydrolase protein [Suillus ampliporus]|nr:Alpha/Beta hydrolase protein [Suillus ampliporus]